MSPPCCAIQLVGGERLLERADGEDGIVLDEEGLARLVERRTGAGPPDAGRPTSCRLRARALSTICRPDAR